MRLSTPTGLAGNHSPRTTSRRPRDLYPTARAPLTSGFGTVMEQEREIQSSTEGYLGVDNDPKSESLNRILRHQQSRLGTNIALLEARSEMLPHPARFHSWSAKPSRTGLPRHPAPAADREAFLPELVAQHLNLLHNIDALIDQRLDGQRGEVMLAEIARNHEEMAWMLTALIKEGESVRDAISPAPFAIARPLSTGEANWENEGGAPKAPLPATTAAPVRS